MPASSRPPLFVSALLAALAAGLLAWLRSVAFSADAGPFALLWAAVAGLAIGALLSLALLPLLRTPQAASEPRAVTASRSLTCALWLGALCGLALASFPHLTRAGPQVQAFGVACLTVGFAPLAILAHPGSWRRLALPLLLLLLPAGLAWMRGGGDAGGAAGSPATGAGFLLAAASLVIALASASLAGTGRNGAAALRAFALGTCAATLILRTAAAAGLLEPRGFDADALGGLGTSSAASGMAAMALPWLESRPLSEREGPHLRWAARGVLFAAAAGYGGWIGLAAALAGFGLMRLSFSGGRGPKRLRIIGVLLTFLVLMAIGSGPNPIGDRWDGWSGAETLAPRFDRPADARVLREAGAASLAASSGWELLLGSGFRAPEAKLHSTWPRDEGLPVSDAAGLAGWFASPGNLLQHRWLEQGALGFVLLVGVMALAFIRARLSASPIARAAAATLVVWVIHRQGAPPHPQVVVMWALGLGVALGAVRISRGRKERSFALPSMAQWGWPLLPLAVAVALLSCCFGPPSALDASLGSPAHLRPGLWQLLALAVAAVSAAALGAPSLRFAGRLSLALAAAATCYALAWGLFAAKEPGRVALGPDHSEAEATAVAPAAVVGAERAWPASLDGAEGRIGRAWALIRQPAVPFDPPESAAGFASAARRVLQDWPRDPFFTDRLLAIEEARASTLSEEEARKSWSSFARYGVLDGVRLRAAQRVLPEISWVAEGAAARRLGEALVESARGAERTADPRLAPLAKQLRAGLLALGAGDDLAQRLGELWP